MKIILRADVEKLGRLGDVAHVRDGYARNCLLPKGLAMAATPANLKVFELERKKLQAKMDALRSSAADMAERINAAEIRLPMRVGDNDKLYGSVTTHMIAAELSKQGLEVDRRRILLDAPIRTLGEFEVRVRLHADVDAKIMLKVVPEEKLNDDSAPAAAASQEDNAAQVEPPAE
jgi:large subunit ribosomal protein L9